jgi:hypothetical protein
VQSLGERLVTTTTGGAVGVISATELSFSSSNAILNQNVYRELFRRDTEACQYHTPLSVALQMTKLGSISNEKYQLMGDAATLMALPRLWVDLTLTDLAGEPVSEVRRGQTLAFQGRVRTCSGGEVLPFDGAVRLLIEDSQEIGFVAEDVITSYSDSASYYYRAGAIYRGDVGVSNGEFRGRFVVPMEAREGDRGRVRAYVEGRTAGEGFDSDGAGYVATRVSPGGAPAGDVTGPRITLSFVGGSTEVRSDAVLKVDLHDQNGILTTNHTPQNGIIVTIATVDGNTTNRADITESFRYAADSYQSGRATFQLPGLAQGAYVVTVSAADNLASGLSAGAHRSRTSLDFTVVDQPSLRITNAYLFPNPTESRWGGGGGQFVVDAPGDSVNVLLRVYTASGRLIRTLTVFGGLGQVQVPWDGMDEEGQPLANGVYFFRVHVNPRDPDGTSSPRQNAHADGRFVIVNRR